MFKYTVFSPYFGKLPNYFNLWLKSCEYNSDFHFVIFTDDTIECVLPKNVSVINISFDEIKKLFTKKLGFEVGLNKPYKLCDFKPAFGFLFNEYIDKEAIAWGHCDMDLIFGDLNKFIPNYQYDKISFLGHFCLYRNDEKITKAFMCSSQESNLNYKDIFSSDAHFGFDEIGVYGINTIFKNNNLIISDFETTAADITFKKNGLVIVNCDKGKFSLEFGKRIFSFKDGVVLSHTIDKTNVIEKEYSYVHFKKRKMIINTGVENSFIITPNSFEEYCDIDVQYIIRMNPVFYFKNNIKQIFKSMKNRNYRKKSIKKIMENKNENV